MPRPGSPDAKPPAADSDELRALLRHDLYPRSGSYDPKWVLESFMGPNVLWSTEALCEHVPLEPGMRVLDLACGTAHSSIFLAREFGVTVWAVDQLISPTENWKRIEDAGFTDRVFPLRGDARDLALPKGLFDAVICVGAYIYFGTDDLYLRTLAPFLRKSGRIAIVVPGVRSEMEKPPAEASGIWKLSFETMHTPEWWRRHFDRSDRFDVEVSDLIPHGGRDWARWLQICMAQGVVNPKLWRADVKMLREDDDKRFGLVRLVARLRSS